MRSRLSLILSATALVVSLLGATPLGIAAVRTVRSIPPLANRANFATVAGNAQHLSGHAASTSGAPGTILLVGKSGKLPASVGTVGPRGATGPAGPAGATGPAGPAGQVDLSKVLSSNVDVVAKSLVMNGSADQEVVTCPSAGWEAVAGGIYTGDASIVTSASWPTIAGRTASDGPPDSDSGPPTGWATEARTWDGAPAPNILVRWFVVCVRPGA